MIKLIYCRNSFLLFLLLSFTGIGFSQNTDSIKVVNNFGAAATITNNGISFIPTFSLDKPAAIFEMSMGRKLSFEPQFRFSLEGKPWSIVFWWRYKLLKTNRFTFNLGTHLGLPFKTITDTIGGISNEILTTKRYLAGELVPNYLLTKNISIGIYYFYSRGIDPGTTKNTHFLTLNANFSNIRLPYQFYMKFTPQVYYLNLDKQDGFYYTATLSLANKKIPLSISTLINKVIRTNITASKDFVWNVSLIYSFNKKYIEQRL